MELTDFKVLSFDCYGTLIDWETGISAALAPTLARSGLMPPRDRVLETYARHEAAQEAETPSMPYSELLAVVHARIAREWGISPLPEESRAFGASVPTWPAFADTPGALRYLKQHYTLVILSNVDRKSFQGTNSLLGVEFDHVFTAQDIGSYKPDPRNFEYMIRALRGAGYEPRQVLHTAESLFHDHLPANKAGLASAWIYRRHTQGGFGATHPPAVMPRYDFRFRSLEEMANAHRQLLGA